MKKYIVEQLIKCTFCGGEGVLYDNRYTNFDKQVIIPGLQNNLSKEEFDIRKEQFWQQYGYSWIENRLPPEEPKCEHCCGTGEEFNRRILTKAEMFEEVTG